MHGPRARLELGRAAAGRDQPTIWPQAGKKGHAMTKAEGRCLCGAIAFEFAGEPNWIVHCHCESCRLATSSPMTTWVSVPVQALRFTKGKPHYFNSSAKARRGFCRSCGSPMTYENAGLPDEVHVYAASLQPGFPVEPSRHVFVEEQVDWLEIHDDLPRFATTSQGSAQPIRNGPRAD